MIIEFLSNPTHCKLLNSQRNMKNTILLFVILTSFSSCMIIGSIVGGKKTTFEKNYTLKLKSSVDKSKADLKQVLYVDGWNKTEEEVSKIQFAKSSSLIKELATSRIEKVVINTTFSGDLIIFQIVQHGNFRAGTEQSVDKTFSTIKAKYERL